MKNNCCHLAYAADAFVVLYAVSTPVKAQNKPITLQLKNTSLLAALDSIRQHSPARFSYNLALVPLLEQTRVSIHSAGDPMETACQIIYRNRHQTPGHGQYGVVVKKRYPPAGKALTRLIDANCEGQGNG